jgi:dCMP deaminase
MFKLDKEFYDAYFKYYGNKASFLVATEVETQLRLMPGWSLASAMNIAKTSAVVGHTYLDFYMEMAARNTFVPAGMDVDKDTFNVAFHYMHMTSPQVLESFLGVRFKVRDIYAEIAKDAFDKTDEETIEKIKAIKTEHTYSIQEPNPESRDRWFYNMAVSVGSYSKCHSRKIGAVLVRDNSVISTGYNGPPRGVPTCDQRWFIDEAFRAKYGHHLNNLKSDAKVKGVCPRRIIGFKSGEGLEICPAGHAERNALINAAKLGISTDNTKLYMTCGVPCSPCAVEIINSGVEEIVCTAMDFYDETTMYLLENSDLKVRLFDFLV